MQMRRTSDFPQRSWLVLLLLAVLGAAACSSLAPTQTAALSTPVVQPKILATLFLSPTPNDQEREATRLAVRVEAPTQPPTRTPAPTPYVGVFAGESSGVENNISFADAQMLEGTLSASLPTLSASGCVNTVDPAFGTTWTSNTEALNALGCAGEPATSYIGTQQSFERGVMYWIPSGEIWSIAVASGQGGRFWYVAQAPGDEGWTVPAPEGLRMPLQGFGAVWKAVDGVRQALGFARADEIAASLAIQRFDNGALVRDETAGQTFVLVGRDAGIAYGPY